MRVLSGAGLFTAPGPDSGVHWAEHLRVNDLSVGTYSIAGGARDDQEPHTEDEVYVVTAGRAALEAGGQSTPVGAGSVIYVQPAKCTASLMSPMTCRSSCCSPRRSIPGAALAADPADSLARCSR